MDLHLKSKWYVTWPPAWPPPTIKRAGYTDNAAYSAVQERSGSRITKTIICASRHGTTLDVLLVRLKWDISNPGGTVKAETKVKHCPKKPNQEELKRWREKYGEALAKWCEGKMGKKVGDGECWTLAANGLQAVGAMRSVGFTHGALIFSQSAASEVRSREARVGRGDVIQFNTAVFRSKDGRRTTNAGSPGHTSIVTGVVGNALHVVECNVGGSKDVKRGHYELEDLVSGDIKISRALPRDWAPKLKAKW